jgi:GTP-binding protein EngB required for normal cell division
MPTHQRHSIMGTDMVIAVMGLTGVGKSSFIKNVTDYEDFQIGHGLTSGARRSLVRINQKVTMS